MIPTTSSTDFIISFIRKCTNSADFSRARQLLDNFPNPDARTWSLLISAHVTHGFPKEGIKSYAKLLQSRTQIDEFVILSVAKACATSSDIVNARVVHKDAVLFGFFPVEVSVGNALVDMYAKCGCIEESKQVFDNMPVKDVVTWTSLASSYASSGRHGRALAAIREMGLKGVKPNVVTLSSLLPICTEMKELSSGREIHGFILRHGMGRNVFVCSALVDMYARCSRIGQAELVFENMSRRDTVSWNVIIMAYFSNNECYKALNLFSRMRNEGIGLNYATWNVVIGGCVQNARTEQAASLLGEMQKSGFKPNQITIATILPAYTKLESLRGGKEMHGYMIRNSFMQDSVAATALVLMYAKCGDLELSCKVFGMIPKRDVIAWNTMIMANSMHGDGEGALLLFKNMLNLGLNPNPVTFVGLLLGCSHSRLVDKGFLIFDLMKSVYSIEPTSDHYSCMVNMLSRAGRLEEAYEFIRKMPMEPTAGAWGALLGACRVHKNIELGRIAGDRLFEIEPHNPGNYVLLSNIFSSAKLWGEVSQTRKLMRERGVTKLPGCSWVYVGNKVYTFVAGDTNNEQSNEIRRFLDDLGEDMRLAGCLPNTDFVLQDVDQEEKEENLCNHSEKLAVAFAILNLKGGSSIRVFKNLRICGDCHDTIKFMAKSVGIQIIVRDSLRFHHFKEGLCSCRDFW